MQAASYLSDSERISKSHPWPSPSSSPSSSPFSYSMVQSDWPYLSAKSKSGPQEDCLCLPTWSIPSFPLMYIPSPSSSQSDQGVQLSPASDFHSHPNQVPSTSRPKPGKRNALFADKDEGNQNQNWAADRQWIQYKKSMFSFLEKPQGIHTQTIRIYAPPYAFPACLASLCYLMQNQAKTKVYLISSHLQNTICICAHTSVHSFIHSFMKYVPSK